MDTDIVKYEKNMSMPVKDSASLRQLLNANQHALLELIPETSGVSLNIIFSGALEAAMDLPALLNCSGMSIIRSVKKAAELGLSLSKELGMAYLIPRKGKAVLQIGYKGWEDLAYRATLVKMIDVDNVYMGDEFKIEKGTKPCITHVINPTANHDDDQIIGSYAVAHFGNGIPERFEWLPIEEIRKIRAVSPASGRGPWVTWFSEMSKSRALIRLCKHLPKSRESRLMEIALQHEFDAVSHNHLIEGGDAGRERFEQIKAEVELPISHPDAEPPEDIIS